MQIMKKCKKHKRFKSIEIKTLRRQLLDKKCKNKKRAKHAKRTKKCTCAPAISTSYLFFGMQDMNSKKWYVGLGTLPL